MFETQIDKFFAKEIIEQPELRNVLNAYTEIMEIKRDIRTVCDVDDPEAIKMLVGKKINNVEITQKFYEHAKTVDEAYQELYQKCKELLATLGEKKNDK